MHAKCKSSINEALWFCWITLRYFLIQIDSWFCFEYIHIYLTEWTGPHTTWPKMYYCILWMQKHISHTLVLTDPHSSEWALFEHDLDECAHIIRAQNKNVLWAKTISRAPGQTEFTLFVFYFQWIHAEMVNFYYHMLVDLAQLVLRSTCMILIRANQRNIMYDILCFAKKKCSLFGRTCFSVENYLFCSLTG